MLEIESTALVIIDIQGKLAQMMYERDRLFTNLQKMINGVQVLELPIIWAEQIPEKLGETIPEVKNLMMEQKPVTKVCFSCRGDQTFMDRLNELGRNQILLIGIETHVCVYQTARDLLKLNYEVYVVTDAVSSRTRADKEVGIQRMKDLGAQITTVEMALFEMLKVARGDKFKKIIKIVK